MVELHQVRRMFRILTLLFLWVEQSIDRLHLQTLPTQCLLLFLPLDIMLLGCGCTEFKTCSLIINF